MDAPRPSDRPTQPLPSTGAPAPFGIGERIGPYRVLSALGEGGFGVVFLAERTEPFVQRVALKVLRPGLATDEILGRFEQERQMLALLDHPGIAKIIDAGSTTDGRPFFAMEYIRGEPITAYCDRALMPTDERLRLFIDVCDAVQHAHQRGVIHRDLKPGNILVTLHDEKPVVKVIDFGVAKAVGGLRAERPVFTEHGRLIGTPEYMSPEQAEAGVLEVDTRTDIYSLGVLLYELLTGRLPFESSTLREAGLREIRRIVRESEPETPSRRLSMMDQIEIRALAQRHRSTPTALLRRVRRELEWIPLRALRKNREERYTSPADMAEDVTNYLEGRALKAGPDSLGYAVRKLCRRYRRPLVGVGLAALVVLGLVGSLSYGLLRAAEASRRERTASRSAEALEQFLSAGLVTALDESAGDEGSRFRGSLSASLPALVNAIPEDGPARSRVLLSVGQALISLGALPEAGAVLTQAERSISGNPAATEADRARLELLRGVAVWRAGDPRAIDALRAALDRAERALGAGDSLILDIRHDLASALKNTSASFPPAARDRALDEAQAAYRAVAVARGPSDPAAQTALFNAALVDIARGQAAAGAGRDAERDEHYRRALDDLTQLGSSSATGGTPDSVLLIEIDSERAKLLGRLRRWPEADDAYQTVIERMVATLGPGHWRTAEMTYSWELLHRRWGSAPEGAAPGRAQRAEAALRTCFAVSMTPGARPVDARWTESESIRVDGPRRAFALATIRLESGDASEAESLLRWAHADLTVRDADEPGRREIASALAALLIQGDRREEAARWAAMSRSP